MAPKHTKILTTAFLVLLAAASAPARQEGHNVQRLTVPGRAWALEINLPDFTVRQNVMSADGRARRLRAEREAEGYVVTVSVVLASTRKVSSKDLRDLAAERVRAEPTVRRDDFRTSQYKQTPTLEYFVREFKGQPLNQKHLNAYVSRDDVWIDIHFSKTLFREGDEKLFYTILDSLRFTTGK